jgi:TRAP transporter TAXI family solute receptor
MHPAQSERIATPLKRTLERALADTDVLIREEPRQLDIVSAVQNGDADIAFAYADIAYTAYVGQLDHHAFDHLRGIAMLNSSPVYVLVRRDSKIQDLDDLRGRRVSLGLPGTRTAVTVQTVLDAFGNDVAESHEAFLDALDKLEAGTVDAVFAVGGYDPIEKLRASVDAGLVRLLSLSQATTGRLRREHPFVHAMMISHGPYQSSPVLTIGVDRLLLCRDTLDRGIVYRVTQTFFDALPELSSSDQQLRQMDVEDAPGTPVPLHEGAARYYREQEQM